MNKFSELFLSLKAYRDDADAIIDGFLSEVSHDKKTYRAEICSELYAKRVETYKCKLDTLRDRKIVGLNDILDDIQDGLKAWLIAPINDRTLNTICALHSCGVKLSHSELEALQDSLGNSYFGQKLIQKIAQDNGDILLGVKDVGRYTGIISDIKSGAELFLNYYSGSKMQGLKLLGDNANNINLVAASCNPSILKDDSVLLQASLLWDGSGIPSPRKKRLSGEELDILNRMYAGFEGVDALKSRTVEIVSGNPDMREVIALSPYWPYLEVAANDR